MSTYTKDVIDAKFETVRQELRADLANLRADIGEKLSALDAKIEGLRGEMKVWGLVAGFAFSVAIVVINHLWK